MNIKKIMLFGISIFTLIVWVYSWFNPLPWQVEGKANKFDQATEWRMNAWPPQ